MTLDELSTKELISTVESTVMALEKTNKEIEYYFDIAKGYTTLLVNMIKELDKR